METFSLQGTFDGAGAACTARVPEKVHRGHGVSSSVVWCPKPRPEAGVGGDLSSLRRKVLSQEDKGGKSNTVSQRKKNHVGESFSFPSRPPSLFVTSIPKLWRQRREREMQPLCTRFKPPPPPPPPRRRARIEAAAADGRFASPLCTERGAARGLFALRPPLRRTPLLVIPPVPLLVHFPISARLFFAPSAAAGSFVSRAGIRRCDPREDWCSIFSCAKTILCDV